MISYTMARRCGVIRIPWSRSNPTAEAVVVLAVVVDAIAATVYQLCTCNPLH